MNQGKIRICKFISNVSKYSIKNGFVLTGGYVFRPIDSYSNISDKPLTSSAVNGRVKSFLFKLNLWEGETPHSTRGGCALTLAWMVIQYINLKLSPHY
jgi:hypothetical protein